MDEQLAAAQEAAAMTSKKAAAAEAAKLRKTAKGAAQVKVMDSAKKTSAHEAKNIARMDSTQKTALVEDLLQTNTELAIKGERAGNRRMWLAMQATAKKVMKTHNGDEDVTRHALHKAMQPVIVKEVNKFASAAAVAGKEAKS